MATAKKTTSRKKTTLKFDIPDLHTALQEQFGFDKFKGQQEEIIKSLNPKCSWRADFKSVELVVPVLVLVFLPGFFFTVGILKINFKLIKSFLIRCFYEDSH